MNVQTRWIVVPAIAWAGIVGAVSVCAAADATPPTTQPAAAASSEGGFPYVGRVTGTNVRVRSGPDGNYYPVCKLGTGDEVTVHEQQYGWLAISPPSGVYSLIDKQYVDKTADGVGVVNDDNVWVRAGSDMDPSRYAKQVMLKKGAEVKIWGETSDGAFYKIAPPEGARLWISAQYVSRGSGKTIAKAPAKPREGSKGDRQPTAPPANRPRPRVTVTEGPTTQPAAFGKYTAEITAIDAAIKLESQKPLGEQNYKPFIEQLRPIAEQTDEPVAQIYAQKRMEQLSAKTDLVSLIADVAALAGDSKRIHDEAQKIRDSIKPPPDVVVDGRVEARGELRPSEIFDGRSKAYPKRYRLVDPAGDKTVAYVEIPPGSGIGVEPYFGKYVAVRAKERKLARGVVQPIPVLPAQEIVELDVRDSRPGLTELPNTDTASGNPVIGPLLIGPTSRPAPERTTPPTSRPAE